VKILLFFKIAVRKKLIAAQPKVLIKVELNGKIVKALLNHIIVIKIEIIVDKFKF
jgi:hypothetical protein